MGLSALFENKTGGLCIAAYVMRWSVAVVEWWAVVAGGREKMCWNRVGIWCDSGGMVGTVLSEGRGWLLSQG